LRAAVAAVLGFGVANVSGATLTWDADAAGAGTGGAGSWDTTSPNWFDGIGYVTWPNANPNSDTALFPATGGVITLGPGIFANALRFDAGGYQINNGGVAANTLTLSGANPTVTVTNPGDLATIGAVVSGTGPLTKAGPGTLLLNNTANSWTGGVTVTGGVLDVAPTAANTNVSIANTMTTSLLGNLTAGAITINGGTLKLSPTGTGAIALNANKPFTFGSNGGVLDLTNTTNVTPNIAPNIDSAGGRITGDIALVLNNSATNPAIIRFNGGAAGISHPDTPRDWSTGMNMVRFGAITGAATGPVRVELTNGAGHRLGNGTAAPVFNFPLTIQGVLGGDTGSGPAGTIDSGVSKTTARVAADNFATFVPAAGLFFENALQVGATGGTRYIDGNITLRGTASGNPAEVAFAGRSTGTAFGPAINAPGATGAGINVLQLGVNGNDTLTVEDGATAILDLRVRSDQNFHHPVLLNSTTVLNPGATLKLKQSLSNNTVLTPVINPASVAYHIIQGNIVGQGTSTSESVIDIALPFDNVAIDNQPLGGVEFQNSSNLIVNGSGFGGLLVRGTARPNSLFALGAPDPVSNADKVANLLSPTRLAGITGTGGYLTPAPTGATFNFPTTGEWSQFVPVGLKVIDNNAAGVDVALATNFGHSVHVAPGATLSTAGATLGTQHATISGTGTITGGFTLGALARLATGANNAGTLTSNGNALLADSSSDVVELITSTVYDSLDVNGTVGLGSGVGPNLLVSLSYDPLATDTFTIIDNDGTDAITGTFAGLPEGATFSVTNPNSGNTFGMQITYTGGTDGNDVVLTAVPEPGTATLAAFGALGLLIRRRRR
jgi:autotransporter-associated beta strand protein